MTKLYTMNDGTTITARNAVELVSKMRRVARLVRNVNDRDFMVEVAERAKLQDHNARIPTNNPENFVRALLAIGFIKMEEDYD